MTAWYALRTKSNCEQRVADGLHARGCDFFLPTYRARRRWSDRVKEVDAPLFPGYIFCNFDSAERLPVISTPGVVNAISFGKTLVPVDEIELNAVRAFLASELPVSPWPFLKVGQRVRIQRGPLTGVEGVIQTMKSTFRLVASVSLLQRSVAVEVDREWVCPA
jgi:transcription antitermination factor NusG